MGAAPPALVLFEHQFITSWTLSLGQEQLRQFVLGSPAAEKQLLVHLLRQTLSAQQQQQQEQSSNTAELLQKLLQ